MGFLLAALCPHPRGSTEREMFYASHALHWVFPYFDAKVLGCMGGALSGKPGGKARDHTSGHVPRLGTSSVLFCLASICRVLFTLRSCRGFNFIGITLELTGVKYLVRAKFLKQTILALAHGSKLFIECLQWTTPTPHTHSG